MTMHVNLLPESYRQNRRRHGRFRLAVGVAGVMLAAELAFGVALYLRTSHTRDLLAEAGDAREAAAELKRQIVAPQQEAGRLDEQVALATELRRTHRWSRLLGTLGEVVPENVVLSSVATDPPRWTRGRGRPAASEGVAPPGKSAESSAKPLIDAITISGYAVDHGNLAEFLAALRASGAFSTIDVISARRDHFMSQDAILFELQCRW